MHPRLKEAACSITSPMLHAPLPQHLAHQQDLPQHLAHQQDLPQHLAHQQDSFVALSWWYLGSASLQHAQCLKIAAAQMARILMGKASGIGGGKMLPTSPQTQYIGGGKMLAH